MPSSLHNIANMIYL